MYRGLYMANFDFLQGIVEYKVFAEAAIEAERVFHSSPSMCAIGCRKALELAVKWVYTADTSMIMPYKDNLQSLLHAKSFKDELPESLWRELQPIVKMGNLAVHSDAKILPRTAIISLQALFNFIEWIDYCYGYNYVERTFDENAIPKTIVPVDIKKIKEQESLIAQNAQQIENLYLEIEKLSKLLSASKFEHIVTRSLPKVPETEAETRRYIIDVDLKLMGWEFEGPNKNVFEEFKVANPYIPGGSNLSVDYVLMGRDGKPLALIEAKKTSRNINDGKTQALAYANALEREYGQRPIIFLSNGYETHMWDDLEWNMRHVSSVYGVSDLERLIVRRKLDKPILSTIPINDDISARSYQKEAIRAVCQNLENKIRRSLLVMATGTGKTRTSVSLVDVLSRSNQVTNVLFLADRIALVSQAKDAFREHLPSASLCNLCESKDDKNARIVFSTYPTILNAIEKSLDGEGKRLFTPGHFDLIIVDESHRSIFKKYRAIFEYFDAILVGLTATPKSEVDRNTFDFFEVENGVPTYAYSYDEAIRDNYLVPYYNFEIESKFLSDGIVYDELSKEDQERLEDEAMEQAGEFQGDYSATEVNSIIYSTDTIDHVLRELDQNGIKTHNGDSLGKTIIFAQNKKHAYLIEERFNLLYRSSKGKKARVIVSSDQHALHLIDQFKFSDGEPDIAISVDMLDTGIDVPACVNLVFFKRIKSKTKFWQMIGRGTRLCPDVEFFDKNNGDYVGKKYFYIFDYCKNFEYFRNQKNTVEVKGNSATLGERIFAKRAQIIARLQSEKYGSEEYQSWRSELVDECFKEITDLEVTKPVVRLQLKYVDKYRVKTSFDYLSNIDEHDLITYVAPLICADVKENLARGFDNFVYEGILNLFNGQSLDYFKKRVISLSNTLLQKISIEQIRKKQDFLKLIKEDTYWQIVDALQLNHLRKELRDLIQFLDVAERRVIITTITDSVLLTREGDTLMPEVFESYQEKVESYFLTHQDHPAIQKLINNEPIDESDYKALEHIFTHELGSPKDYENHFKDKEFGLVVRDIVKMRPEAAEKAFSNLINTKSMNSDQINFIKLVINYIEVNGYMESPKVLLEPPFDRPFDMWKLFDQVEAVEIANIVNQIKNNACIK